MHENERAAQVRHAPTANGRCWRGAEAPRRARVWNVSHVRALALRDADAGAARRNGGGLGLSERERGAAARRHGIGCSMHEQGAVAAGRRRVGVARVLHEP